MKKILCMLALLLTTACATNQKASNENSKKAEGFDKVLTGYEYPYPVSYYNFEGQGQKLQMAYMDVKPEGPTTKTIVMLHGKNFSGYYFAPIVKELVKKGYRVIVPDQIGFGKSTKPENFQYSFP